MTHPDALREFVLAPAQHVGRWVATVPPLYGLLCSPRVEPLLPHGDFLAATVPGV
jgi:hypothetical protein